MEIDKGAGAVAGVTVHGRRFDVSVYAGGQPRVFGRVIACDTETTLIDDDAPYETTDLVVAQFCDGTSVEVVPYDLVPDYLKVLESTCPGHLLVFYNVGFDSNVLRKRDPKLWKHWLEPKFDKGEIVDVGLRYTLAYISEKGWLPKRESLALLAERELGYLMNKDAGVRLSFTRDMLLTPEHVKYAALDAAVTWLLADKKEAQPTEALQTRGAYALYQISKNGFLVDRERFEEHRTRLKAALESGGFDLRAFGYRPTKQTKKTKAIWTEVCDMVGLAPADAPSTPSRVRHACCRAAKAVLERAGGVDVDDVMDELAVAIRAHVGKRDLEEAMPYLVSVARECGAEGLEAARKLSVLTHVVHILVKGVYDYKSKIEILQELSREWDDNAGWDDTVQVGAGTFLQNRLAEIERMRGITLPRTKSDKISATKATLDEMARNGVTDPFFDKLREYKHTEKLLGTYVNPKYIKRDGRVHARYSVLVRTGRTSASSPSVQNWPRGDGMRGVFVAPQGKVLVATDYSAIELASLSQHCYTTQGYSRMRDIINADVDLHCWFAARCMGLITDANDIDVNDQSSIDRVKAICKTEEKGGPIPKERRQLAKAS